MSRIGKLPISIPEGVTVQVDKNNVVRVKGKLGELIQQLSTDIKVEVVDGQLNVKRLTDQKQNRAFHGLYRSLIHNMIIGVTEGYTIVLELVGVGYRAENKGQILELALGYSHQIHIELPTEVTVETKTERRSNPLITLKSIDKQLIGQVAAKIRSFRKPEPYKGKGIKFQGEQLRRKAGKAAAAM